MDVPDVVRRKKAYTQDFVASVPSAARERIRLLYDII
jgi:hypothetical protein